MVKTEQLSSVISLTLTPRQGQAAVQGVPGNYLKNVLHVIPLCLLLPVGGQVANWVTVSGTGKWEFCGFKPVSLIQIFQSPWLKGQ